MCLTSIDSNDEQIKQIWTFMNICFQNIKTPNSSHSLRISKVVVGDMRETNIVHEGEKCL